MFESLLLQTQVVQDNIGYILTVVVPLLVSAIYGVIKNQQTNKARSDSDSWRQDYQQLDIEHQRAKSWLQETITSGVRMVLSNRDVNIDQAKFDVIADSASQKLIEIADKAGIPVDEIVDKLSAMHGVSSSTVPPATVTTATPTPQPPATTKPAPQVQASDFKFEGLPAALQFGQAVAVKVTPKPSVAMLLLYESDSNKTKSGLVEIDQTSDKNPDTLTFKVPPSDSPFAKRYRPGYYLLHVHANDANGVGFGQEYLLQLA